MILPDDTPESPTKSRAGPLSDVPDEDYIAPPPAYPGHSWSHQLDVEAQAGTSRTPLTQPQYHIEQVERAPTRFLKAFGIAVIIFFAFGSLARSTFVIAQWRNYPPGGRKGHNEGQIPLPRPVDGKVEGCIQTNVNSPALVSYHLPLSADILYLFSRGGLKRGTVTFSAAEGGSIPRDTVQVDITFTPQVAPSLDMVNFCMLERAPGESGIGIFSPSKIFSDLEFTANVQFPVSRKKALQIKRFETDLPMFQHIMSGLRDKVRFGSISLSSQNMPIHSDYLDAESASLTTANHKISGEFHVSGSLHLQTTTRDIAAEITLDNDDSQPQATNLTIINSNGAVTTHLKLRSTAPHALGGRFNVRTTNQNNPLLVAVGDQPRASTLLLDVNAMNAPVSVTLPPAYEGALRAMTSQGDATLVCDESARDPSGQNGRRACDVLSRSPHEFVARTAWDLGVLGGRHGAGSVRVFDLNAPVKLIV
ncbi:hypothetical protein C8Q79DRAFT_1119747 [Trametes meyenii]|nr:hypothetical protein C8Q79DRAFT_1119747 [Trametes meyenii]